MRIPSEILLQPHINSLSSCHLGGLIRLWCAWISNPKSLSRDNLQLLSGLKEDYFATPLHTNQSLYFEQDEDGCLIPLDLLGVRDKESKLSEMRAKSGRIGGSSKRGRKKKAAQIDEQKVANDPVPNGVYNGLHEKVDEKKRR